MSPAPSNSIPQDLRFVLDEWGVTVVSHREIDYATQYYLERGPESVRLNVYTTGKVTVQGPSSGLKDLLQGRIAARGARRAGANVAGSGSTPALDGTARVGIDEAGKGEYLGPLVVAGTRVLGAKKDLELREIGVRDSKTLGLRQVREVAAGVGRMLGPENTRVISLAPREYEARRTTAGGNVNRLLGELNAEIIYELKGEVEVIVMDAFGEKARSYVEPHVPEGVRLEVRPRAEDDAAVAAASILARARYLEEMEKLSEQIGFELPRGSTHVLDAGRRVFEERGMAGLREVAKTSFRTTQQITGGAF